MRLAALQMRVNLNDRGGWTEWFTILHYDDEHEAADMVLRLQLEEMSAEDAIFKEYRYR